MESGDFGEIGEYGENGEFVKIAGECVANANERARGPPWKAAILAKLVKKANSTKLLQQF